MKIPCTVEVLTRNSAVTLGRCLESVKDFAEIIVLDGNSTDRSLEIARRYGCKIYKQYDTDEPNIAIKDYSEVRNKGLRLASYDWFMYIDSDEYLSEEAVGEIRSIIENPKPPAYIFWQSRKYVLNGKVIECATTYPNKQVRFFHRDHVEGFVKPIHERIESKLGEVTGMLHGVEYLPVEPLAALKARWERYIHAERKMAEGRPLQKRVKAAWRQFSLFLFYAFRYLRNLFLCRGSKMPWSYEWARHQHLLKLAVLLLQRI